MMLSVLGFLALLLLRLLLGLLLLVLFLVLLVLVVPFRYDFHGHRYDADAAADAFGGARTGEAPDAFGGSVPGAAASAMVDAAASGACGWLFGLISVAAVYDPTGGLRVRMYLLSRWVLKTFRKGADAASAEAGALPDAAVAAQLKREAAQKRRKEAAAEKKAERTKRTKRTPQRKFRLTQEKLLLLVNAGMRALRRVMPARVRLDARIGFDDPADTGTLCAVLGPLQALFQDDPDRFDIRIVPDFETTALVGALEMKGSIQLWFIVWEGLKLAISRPFRQDIFARLQPHAKRFTRLKQQAKQVQGGYDHV